MTCNHERSWMARHSFIVKRQASSAPGDIATIRDCQIRGTDLQPEPELVPVLVRNPVRFRRMAYSFVDQEASHRRRENHRAVRCPICMIHSSRLYLLDVLEYLLHLHFKRRQVHRRTRRQRYGPPLVLPASCQGTGSGKVQIVLGPHGEDTVATDNSSPTLSTRKRKPIKLPQPGLPAKSIHQLKEPFGSGERESHMLSGRQLHGRYRVEATGGTPSCDDRLSKRGQCASVRETAGPVDITFLRYKRFAITAKQSQADPHPLDVPSSDCHVPTVDLITNRMDRVESGVGMASHVSQNLPASLQLL